LTLDSNQINQSINQSIKINQINQSISLYYLQDVVHSLQEKLSIKKIQHFNLVLLNVKSHMPNRVILLQEHETLAEVRQMGY
jgi:hypothetical protein